MGWFLLRRFGDLIRVYSLLIISRNHSNTFKIELQKEKNLSKVKYYSRGYLFCCQDFDSLDRLLSTTQCLIGWYANKQMSKFLFTAFSQNTSSGCFWNFIITSVQLLMSQHKNFESSCSQMFLFCRARPYDCFWNSYVWLLLKFVEYLFLEDFFVSFDKFALLYCRCLMPKFSGILVMVCRKIFSAFSNETFSKLCPPYVRVTIFSHHFLLMIGNIFVQSWLIRATFHAASGH